MSRHKLYLSNLDGDNLNLNLSASIQCEKRGKEKTQFFKKLNSSPCLNGVKQKNKTKEISSAKKVNSFPGKNVMKQKEKEKESSSSTKSNSSSDSIEDMVDYHSLAGNKLPYKFEEDEFILKFLLKGGNIFKASSISIWKYLESKKENPKRTYQSLKNRFLRNIKPNIFSTYKHLVTDNETVQNIIQKFPELEKEAIRINNASANLNLPNRNAIKIRENATTKSTGTSSTSATDKQRLILKNNKKRPQSINRLSNKKSKKSVVKKKVELKNDCIFITVNFNNSSEDSSPVTDSLGIYNKYLSCKSKNVITPCSYCGRGDPKLDIEDEGQTESVNFISSSVDSTKKRVVHKPFEDSERPTDTVRENLEGKRVSERISQRKRASEKIIQPMSPSLLEDATNIGECNAGQRIDKTNGGPKESVITRAPVIESSSDKDASPKSNSNELFSETDLNSLFRGTIADCRKFMDSEEDERLVNEYFKKTHNMIDTFFMDKDLSDSQSTNSSPELATELNDSVNYSIKNCSNNMAPLAKNMVKMLTENPEGRKKLDSFSKIGPPKLKNI